MEPDAGGTVTSKSKTSMFQSKAWQDAWWGVWGNTAGFALVQAGTDSWNGSGLYIDSYRYQKILPVRCLQYVGTSYRRLSTPRTEYNCLASSTENSAERLGTLTALDWTEAVFRDIRADGEDAELIKAWAEANGWWVREVHHDRAYSVATSGDFSAYIAELGASTRLKLVNRRKVLESLGKVQLENFWPSSSERFFSLLNEFHVQRWGTPCFNENSIAFHLQFLRLVEAEGGAPDLSVIMVDGDPVSVAYNMKFNHCVYNLQSGFNENFHKKVALGTLHLGYSLEHAFRTPDTTTFDLLAGSGKNSDYKIHLADTHSDLVSLMVVRSQLHQTLYRCKEELSRIKQFLGRKVR